MVPSPVIFSGGGGGGGGIGGSWVSPDGSYHTVQAYYTSDFTTYTNLGIALPLDARLPGTEFRPHVVYNAKTKKFLMWFEDRGYGPFCPRRRRFPLMLVTLGCFLSCLDDGVISLCCSSSLGSLGSFGSLGWLGRCSALYSPHDPACVLHQCPGGCLRHMLTGDLDLTFDI